ncbi:MAG: cysteine synthase family protein [Chloroflexota bacterium]|nr:cysteine synthase family protein [Chloroflexota bacterium]
MPATVTNRRAPGLNVQEIDQLGVVKLIGNTPLVHLHRLSAHLGLPTNIQLLLKAEWVNPGGSIKDRTALAIIRDAVDRDRLGHGQTLLDSTSGNTGIAYAMLGAALNLPVSLVVPASASDERKRTLAAYGASLVYSDPFEGSDGAIRLVREMVARTGDDVFFADQYNNPANVAAHWGSTGPEILRQSRGQVTHFVAALGTTGTIVGAGSFLQQEAGARIIAVQPDEEFHGIEGLKYLPTAIVPGIFDPAVPDEIVGVETEDAFAYARLLATTEGLFAGSSTGANVAATARLGASLAERGEPAVIVAIGCDGGSRYLTTGLWDR